MENPTGNRGIYHADVDESMVRYLPLGEISPECISPDSLPPEYARKTTEILTVKSQSRITGEVLDAFPVLRLIITRTVGTDHIDLEVCRQRGVSVKNIPNYGPQSVAEHALALILACARHIVDADREVRTGLYSYRRFPGTAIGGKTVGIIGTGRIGLELMKLLKPFGVTLLAYDIYENTDAASDIGFTYAPLADVLPASDILSLHIPLTPQTRHMIGGREFRLMKDGAILVNTSRGAIIDTAALIAYAEKLKAIGLDVVEGEESFSADHPILKVQNVVMTPHIAFFSDAAVREIGETTMGIISEYRRTNHEVRPKRNAHLEK